MFVKVENDYDAMSQRGAEIVAEVIRQKPNAVLGLATGSTPEGLEHIATWNAGMMQGSEMAEAFEAKAQKRAPVYQNLPPRKKGL